MYFLYVDESGSPEPHSEPLGPGETPLFCLSALAVHESQWRQLSRDHALLKRGFFKKEIGNREAAYYEVKGNTLTAPRQKASSRRRAFAEHVFHNLEAYGARAFSIVFLKNPVAPTAKAAMYGMALRLLAGRFQAFLEECSPGGETGIMILDSRTRRLDSNVAKSHLNYVFGHEAGRTLDRVIEAPLFAESVLTPGLQLVDIVGAYVYSYHYQGKCSAIGNAVDYAHVAPMWPIVKRLEFKSERLYDGHPRYGFRILDHRDAVA